MTNEEALEILTKERVKRRNASDGYPTRYAEALGMAIKALEIELLTDREQRIFLKAINREREVCQKVDDEYSDNDSKVSLVKVCNSIERKVKKIWD
jgi:hypothetical protein